VLVKTETIRKKEKQNTSFPNGRRNAEPVKSDLMVEDHGWPSRALGDNQQSGGGTNQTTNCRGRLQNLKKKKGRGGKSER